MFVNQIYIVLALCPVQPWLQILALIHWQQESWELTVFQENTVFLHVNKGTDLSLSYTIVNMRISVGVKGILLNSEVWISAHSGYTASFNIRATVGRNVCFVLFLWNNPVMVSQMVLYYFKQKWLLYQIFHDWNWGWTCVQILTFSDNSNIDLGGKRSIRKLCTHLYIHSCFYLWTNV